MSSRKVARAGGTINSFKEKDVFKASSNKKNVSHFRDGFFIKSSGKNKKNVSSDVTVSERNKLVAAQREMSQKDLTHTQQDASESKGTTKPFDKKAWRFKRYSKKYKLDNWKDVRKTNLRRGYDKTLKVVDATPFNFEEKYMDDVEDSTQQETNLLSDNNIPTSNTDKKSTKSERNLVVNRNQKFNKGSQVDEELSNRKLESLKRKAEKEKAMQEYKRKKLEKFKKLSRKTKKGQPVMKDRIEVLLEEIQNSMRH